MALSKPQQDEYADYFAPYIERIPDGQLISLLEVQPEEMILKLGTLSDDLGSYRYSEGKWSLKEVIGHITDTERIMSYRLLRIARGDQTPLAGFSEESYVNHAAFDRRSILQLLKDFSIVRESTLALIRQLDDEAWLRTGVANDSVISARAVAYLIAGHADHHFQVIKERYLNNGVR